MHLIIYRVKDALQVSRVAGKFGNLCDGKKVKNLRGGRSLDFFSYLFTLGSLMAINSKIKKILSRSNPRLRRNYIIPLIKLHSYVINNYL